MNHDEKPDEKKADQHQHQSAARRPAKLSFGV
jgi:hypothetical protein